MRWAKASVTGEPSGPMPGAFARTLTQIFGTGLGTGYAPVAQGTFASLLWVLLWAWVVPSNLAWELGVVVAVHLISVPLSAWGERMWGHDPGRVTVDEFAGQAIALVAVPHEPLLLAAAFVLFRVFDTFKPPFVRRHIETLPGGWGVTLDDTVAGLLARLVLFLIMLLM